MTDWASIRSCQELTDAQIGEVIESRDDVRVLLAHLAQVARPEQGGPRVLLLFARLATPECDWLEGALQLTLRGDGMGTTIESFAEIGGGLRERVVPKVVLPVPIGEFLDVIARFPHLIAPLAVLEATGSHATLVAHEAEHRARESELPDEDDEAAAADAAETRAPSVVPLTAFDLPAVRVQRPIPKAPRVGLPVVLPTSATQAAPAPPPPVVVAPPPPPPASEPPVAKPAVRPPPRSRAPAQPPPKRTQVVLGRIGKAGQPKPPVADERRDVVARRHPAADPTEPPPAPSKKDGEDVDGGWD